MRRRTVKKATLWLAPGCLLWLSCPSGTGQFLVPIVQPIIGQILSDVAFVLTDNIIGTLQTP